MEIGIPHDFRDFDSNSLILQFYKFSLPTNEIVNIVMRAFIPTSAPTNRTAPGIDHGINRVRAHIYRYRNKSQNQDIHRVLDLPQAQGEVR